MDANEYVDKVAVLLNEKLDASKLQDIQLPPLTMDFNRDIACGIVLPGQMILSDGNVSGVSSFCRMGMADLQINVSLLQ